MAIRCTGLALAFNIAEGYFGGTTPLIAAWLVSTSGNPLLPGYWVAASGAITLITALWFTPETYRMPLDHMLGELRPQNEGLRSARAIGIQGQSTKSFWSQTKSFDNALM